jgi:hypothetical protein
MKRLKIQTTFDNWVEAPFREYLPAPTWEPVRREVAPCAPPPSLAPTPQERRHVATMVANMLSHSLQQFDIVDQVGCVFVVDLTLPKHVDPRLAVPCAWFGPNHSRVQDAMREIYDYTLMCMNRGVPAWYYDSIVRLTNSIDKMAAASGVLENRERQFFLEWWGWAAALPFEAQPELARRLR